MRGRQWKALTLATIAAVAFTACAGDEGGDAAPAGDEPATTQQPGSQAEAPANLPEGVTPEQYQEGRQVFAGPGLCMSCHGPDATGTALAPDLTDDEWLNISGRNYEEIVEVVRTGVPEPVEHPGPMPPMGGASLDDAQVEAVAAYVAGLGQG